MNFFIHQLSNNRDKFMHLFIGSSITKARQCKKLKNKNYICACPISLQTFSLNDLGQIENY